MFQLVDVAPGTSQALRRHLPWSWVARQRDMSDLERISTVDITVGTARASVARHLH